MSILDFDCCNICCHVYQIYMRLNCVTELQTLFYWSMVICRILTCICDVFQWTCMLFGLQNIDWFANYLLVCKLFIGLQNVELCMQNLFRQQQYPLPWQRWQHSWQAGDRAALFSHINNNDKTHPVLIYILFILK